jgi:hypothetical protein
MALRQSSSNSRRSLWPASDGAGGIGVGSLAVSHMHASLILHGPGDVWSASSQSGRDRFVARRACIDSIEKNNVDIIEQRAIRHATVHSIPHGVSDEAGADPAIRQRQLLHRLQEPHHIRLPLDECANIFSTLHPVGSHPVHKKKGDMVQQSQSSHVAQENIRDMGRPPRPQHVAPETILRQRDSAARLSGSDGPSHSTCSVWSFSASPVSA